MASLQKTRHNARKLALQALYQWHYNPCPVKELFQAIPEKNVPEAKIDYAYFTTLVKGVIENISSLDATLEPFLDRKFSELTPIELAALRIAAYEMHYFPDLSYKIIITEAIEIVRHFGSADGHKYVNAILDRFAKK